jgi:hypothetical protein
MRGLFNGVSMMAAHVRGVQFLLAASEGVL